MKEVSREVISDLKWRWMNLVSSDISWKKYLRSNNIILIERDQPGFFNEDYYYAD